MDEALAVYQAVPEFNRQMDRAALEARLAGLEHLILVAEQEQRLLGFKVGFGLDAATFYSWLGGVIPSARRTGVAQALMDAQEAWAKARGYGRIRVKSMDEFPAMLRFLAGNQYREVGRESGADTPQPKILFLKVL